MKAQIKEVSTPPTQPSEAMHLEPAYWDLLRVLPQPIWLIATETLGFIAVNDAAVRHYGYSREAFLGMSCTQLWPPEDVPAMRAAFQRQAFAGFPKASLERHYRQAGDLIQVEVMQQPVIFAGCPARLVVIHDVTSHHRTAENQREYIAQLLMGQSIGQLGTWTYDSAGQRWTASEEVFRIFGHPAGQWPIDRETLLAQLLPDDQMQVRAAFDQAVRTRQPYVIDYRMIRPDGQVLWVRETGEVRGEGDGLRAEGIIQDVTDQHAPGGHPLQMASQHLPAQSQDRTGAQLDGSGPPSAADEQRIRADERQRVARDAHDEVGALLTALKIELALSVGHPHTKIIADLVDDAIGAVRRLATDGRPPLLDRLDVWQGIEWLAADFENRLHIRCAVSMTGNRPEVDGNLAITLFRIVQEALTNIARHAHATAVQVSIWSNAAEIIACIQDNGRGMRLPLAEQSQGLCGMRERAAQLDGTVEIASQPGAGTCVRIHLPVMTVSRAAPWVTTATEVTGRVTGNQGAMPLSERGPSVPGVAGKVVRDGFSMPENDYRIISELQQKFRQVRLPVSKSQLLRAALRYFESVPYPQQLACLQGLERLKAGRPPKPEEAPAASPHGVFPA